VTNIADVNPLADLVRARCESAACGLTTGNFGAGSVSNVFCEDQADDYIPVGADLNSGEHVAALQVGGVPVRTAPLYIDPLQLRPT